MVTLDARQEIVVDQVTGRMFRKSDEIAIQAPSLRVAAAQAIATAGTINVNTGEDVFPLTVAAGSTGVLLTAGMRDGQVVYIANTSASNTVTMAAVGTSFVANGVTDVIAVLTTKEYVWLANAATPAWYPVTL